MNPSQKPFYEKTKVMGITPESVNEIRIEKGLTVPFISEKISEGVGRVDNALRGCYPTYEVLIKIYEFIKNHIPHFKNIPKRQMNNVGLERLGFSRWEINRIL